MKVRPASDHGFSRAERDLVFMAGVEVDLAPWEYIDLPDEIGRELIRRSKYKLQGGPAGAGSPTSLHRYEIKVRATCP